MALQTYISSSTRKLNSNLADFTADIVETTEHSEYFNIFKIQEEYGKGVHTVVIRGSEKLKKGTYILIDIIDEHDNAIPINVPPLYESYEQKLLPNRRFTFEIDESNVNGTGRMIFVGTTKGGEKVKFEKTFSINTHIDSYTLNNRGQWTLDTFYEVGDVVQYSGSSFATILAHNSANDNEPPDPTYWDILAEGGSGITFYVTGTNGTVFKNNQGTTDLQAKLFDGGQVVSASAYRWYEDGNLLASESGSSLTVTALDVDNKTSYTVEADYDGSTFEYTQAVIDIADGTEAITPFIDTPDGIVFKNGTGSITLEAELFKSGSVVSTGSISYQWYQDGTTLTSETGSSITIVGADVQTSSVFKVDQIYNGVTYDAYETVFDVFDGESIRAIIESGDNEGFRFKNSEGLITLTGSLYEGASLLTAGLTYQWLKNGVPISGETTRFLSITPSDITQKEVFEVDIDDGGKVFDARQDILDVTDGAGLYINSTDGFQFKNNSGSTTLTARLFEGGTEVTSGVTYSWTKDGGTPFATTKSITVNATDFTNSAVYEVTAEYKQKTYTFSQIMTDVEDGYTPILTNEGGFVIYDAQGIGDYTNATTIFEIYRGSNEVTSDFTLSVASSSPNVSYTFDPVTGLLEITSIPEGENGHVILQGVKGSLTLTKRFNVQTVSEGATGSAGQDAKAVFLRANQYTVRYESDGTKDPSNNPITLSASAQNHEGTVYYEFLKDDVALRNSTDNYYTLSASAEPAVGEIAELEVRTRENSDTGTVIALDTINVFAVKDGDNAMTIIMTNEAHTFPADNGGTVNDYSGGTTKIIAYQGATKLTHNTGTLSDGEYQVSITGQTNITSGSVSTVGGEAVTSAPSNMTQDSASLDFTIEIDPLIGINSTFEKTQSFSKSIKGDVGQDAFTLTMHPQGLIFEESQDGAITPQNIALSASLQNYSDTVSWTYKDTGTQFDTGLNTTVSASAVTDQRTIVASTTSPSLSDETTLVRLKEGSDSINSILSNESHTVPSDSDGSNPDLSGAVCTITIFKGINDITNEWTISAGGGTTLLSGDYSLVGDTVTITGMPSDSETFQFLATHPTYPDVVKNFSLSKSKKGNKGNTGKRGVTYIFKGIWDSGATYTYDDEVASDVVLSSSTYYYLSGSADFTSTGDDPATTSAWQTFDGQFESVATDFLLAQDVTIRRSLTMGDATTESEAYGSTGVIRSLGFFGDDGEVYYNPSQFSGSAQRFYELDYTGISATSGSFGNWKIFKNTIESLNTGGSGIRLDSEKRLIEVLSGSNTNVFISNDTQFEPTTVSQLGTTETTLDDPSFTSTGGGAGSTFTSSVITPQFGKKPVEWGFDLDSTGTFQTYTVTVELLGSTDGFTSYTLLKTKTFEYDGGGTAQKRYIAYNSENYTHTRVEIILDRALNVSDTIDIDSGTSAGDYTFTYNGISKTFTVSSIADASTAGGIVSNQLGNSSLPIKAVHEGNGVIRIYAEAGSTDVGNNFQINNLSTTFTFGKQSGTMAETSPSFVDINNFEAKQYEPEISLTPNGLYIRSTPNLFTRIGAGYDTTGGDSTIVSGGGTVDWSNITGKPSTFTPSTHTHSSSEITDFTSAVQGVVAPDSDFQPVGTGDNVSFGSGTFTGNVTIANTQPRLFFTDTGTSAPDASLNRYADRFEIYSDDRIELSVGSGGAEQIGISSTNVNIATALSAVSGTFSGAISATTLDTGQGANELYPMNQAVRTSDSPTFSGATFNGNVELESGYLWVKNGISYLSGGAIVGSSAVPTYDFEVDGNSQFKTGWVWVSDSFLQVDDKVGIGASPYGSNRIGNNTLQVSGSVDVLGSIGFIIDGSTQQSSWRMFQGGSVPLLVMKNFNSNFGVIDIRGSGVDVSNTNINSEATIALYRGNDAETNSEFLDLYNNGYTSSREYGINIQKRGTGEWRRFLFGFDDGTTYNNVFTINPPNGDNNFHIETDILFNTEFKSDDYESGILGAGSILNNDASNGSLIEVDNMRIRGTLRTHIFKKDIYRASNAYLWVSDSTEIADAVTTPSTVSTSFTITVKEAVFANGMTVEYRDADEVTGTISGVELTITSSSTSRTLNGQTVYDYSATLNTGTSITLRAGDTVVRTSGNKLLLNGSSDTDAPYMDVLVGANIKARVGNLDEAPDLSDGTVTSGYGLYSDNVFLEGGIVASYGSIGGWTINATTLSASNIDFDSSTNNGQINVGTNGDFWNGNNSFQFGGSTGIVYTGAGDVEVGTGVVVSGSLSATSGTIGGWNINSTTLEKVVSGDGLRLNSSTSAIELLRGNTAKVLIQHNASDAEILSGDAIASSSSFSSLIFTTTGTQEISGYDSFSNNDTIEWEYEFAFDDTENTGVGAGNSYTVTVRMQGSSDNTTYTTIKSETYIVEAPTGGGSGTGRKFITDNGRGYDWHRLQFEVTEINLDGSDPDDPQIVTYGVKEYESEISLSNKLLTIASSPNLVTKFGAGFSQTQVTVSTIAWGDITNKPATFPPDTHTHSNISITAGGGLSGGTQNLGSDITISHADTSTMADVSTSANTYVSGVDVDGYGHVQGVSRRTITGGTGITVSGDTISLTNTLDNYQSWNFQVNSGTTEAITTGDTLNFVEGTGINITKGADQITIASSITQYSGWSIAKLSGASTLIQSGDLVEFAGSGATNITWDGTNNIMTISSQNDNNYANSLTFNSGTGDLELGRQGLTTLTESLDGRYSLTTHSHSFSEITGTATDAQIPTTLSIFRLNSTGTQMYIEAGEMQFNATNHGGEIVYIGGEGGVQVASSVSNSGTADNITTLIDGSGNASFGGNISATGNVLGSNLNITNWNTAYTHSQVTTGNPHNISAGDVGAVPDNGGNFSGPVSIDSMVASTPSTPFRLIDSGGNQGIFFQQQTAGGFIPQIRGRTTGDSGDQGLILLAQIQPADDTGTTSVLRLQGEQDDGSAIVSRRVIEFRNAGTTMGYFASDNQLYVGGSQVVFAGHKHTESDITDLGPYDNYSAWQIAQFGGASTNINTGELVEFAGSGATSVSWNGTSNVMTISSQNDNNYANSLTFNTANGVLTLGRQGLTDITENLDGRYALNTGDTFSGRVVLDGDATRMRRGLNGSYGDSSDTGSNWGANIWSIGDSWDGSGYGTGFTIGNQYGLTWLRDTHPSSTADDEGLYLWRGGTNFATIGTDGSSFSGIISASGGNSSQWNTAYTHSQVTTGNPHNLDSGDVGAVPSTGGTFSGGLTVTDGGFDARESAGTWFDATVTDNSASQVFRAKDSGGNIIANFGTVSFNGTGGGYVNLDGDWRIGGNFILTTASSIDASSLAGVSSGNYARTDTGVTTEQFFNNVLISGTFKVDNFVHINRNSNEQLRINHASGTGSPFISWRQSGTQRAFVQYEETGDTFRIVNEYGKVEIWAGSGGAETNEVQIGQSSAIFQNQISAPEYVFSSDKRLKKDEQKIESVLDLLIGLNVYSFNKYKSNGKLTGKEYGYFAQDVQKVFPYAVCKGEDDYLNLKVGSMTALNTKGIQELKDYINELEARVEELEDYHGIA